MASNNCKIYDICANFKPIVTNSQIPLTTVSLLKKYAEKYSVTIQEQCATVSNLQQENALPQISKRKKLKNLGKFVGKVGT